MDGWKDVIVHEMGFAPRAPQTVKHDFIKASKTVPLNVGQKKKKVKNHNT